MFDPVETTLLLILLERADQETRDPAERRVLQGMIERLRRRRRLVLAR